MGGINSLSGLSNVSVDFRPTIETNVQNTGNANQPQPGADAVPEGAPQLGNAKSVVQQLDVLLVHAAGKSVSADAVKNVKKVGESLTDLGRVSKDAGIKKLGEDGAIEAKRAEEVEELRAAEISFRIPSSWIRMFSQ